MNEEEDILNEREYEEGFKQIEDSLNAMGIEHVIINKPKKRNDKR
jgi:hypothetical protein